MENELHNENIVYKNANPLKRFAAFVLDSFIVYPIYLVLYYIAFNMDMNLGTNQDLIMKGFYNFLFLTFLLTTWIVFKGQSIGQMIMKIKIVSVDNEELKTSQYFLRMLGWLACNITFGIGFLVMFFNKDYRGLHDYTSKSKVVEF